MLKRKVAQCDRVGSIFLFSTSKHVVIPSSGISKVKSVVISGCRVLRTMPHMMKQMMKATDFLFLASLNFRGQTMPR